MHWVPFEFTICDTVFKLLPVKGMCLRVEDRVDIAANTKFRSEVSLWVISSGLRFVPFLLSLAKSTLSSRLFKSYLERFLSALDAISLSTNSQKP